MSRTQDLHALQLIDSKIDATNASLARIENDLNDTAILDAARQVFLDADTELKKARSTLRDLEFESENCAKHVADLEKKLYGGQIKGIKEMQSAEQEIETFKNRRKDLDDKSVEAMIAIEEAEEIQKNAKKKLTDTEVSREANCAGLKTERDKLLSELPVYKAERDKQALKIQQPDLALYERLRHQKQGIAVAEMLTSKMCGKCRVELPLAKQREVKIPGSMVICPSCGRILFLH